jgi:pyrimidine operon attenuation protein/uracil phosphoribosyltransferase
MKILNHNQIDHKVQRLAFQILEENHKVKQLYFLGINKSGYSFAEMLMQRYDAVSGKESILGRVSINAAEPTSSEVSLDLTNSLNGKNIIIVDDVANTGRTLFYAIKPILEYLPKKVEAAVLVDRKHKRFPIKVDYVGLSLATTLKENINVSISKTGKLSAYLK